MSDNTDYDPMRRQVMAVVTHTKFWIRGSLVTWDNEAKAGYLTVCPDPGVDGDAMCCHRVDRTIELAEGVNADVDGEGCIYGIETLGHEVGIADLILALRWYQRNGSSRADR